MGEVKGGPPAGMTNQPLVVMFGNRLSIVGVMQVGSPLTMLLTTACVHVVCLVQSDT